MLDDCCLTFYDRGEKKEEMRMVTSIARQSVIIKCNMQASVLTGNYEFYYAAGLAARLAGIEVADDILPDELKGLLAERMADCVPKDEKEAYLYGLLLDYRQTGEYDAQMKELLICGREEKQLWSVVISESV